jgi:hypothetical protein
MSRVVVRAELDGKGVKTGLAELRQNMDAFEHHAGTEMFGRGLGGVLSKGLLAAGGALVALRGGLELMHAAWEGINEEADKYNELVAKGAQISEGKSSAGMVEFVRELKEATHELGPALASLFGQFDGFADKHTADLRSKNEEKSMDKLADSWREDRSKRGDVQEKYDLEHSKESGDSVGVRTRNIDRELEYLEKKMKTAEAGGFESRALEIQTQIEDKQRSRADIVKKHEDEIQKKQADGRAAGQKSYEETLTAAGKLRQTHEDILSLKMQEEELSKSADAGGVGADQAREKAQEKRIEREKLEFDLAKQKRDLALKLKEENYQVMDLHRQIASASSRTAVVSGQLSSGISLAGERAYFQPRDSRLIELGQKQADLLKDIKSNTNTLGDLMKTR